MLRLKHFAATAAFTMTLAGGLVQASTISLNFATGTDPAAGGNNPSYDLGPTDTAGVAVVANDHWNNLHLASGTAPALTLGGGGSSTASVTWASNGTYQAFTSAPANPDYAMMQGGLDERGTGFGGPVPATVTVTLPAGFGPYNVYAYFDASTQGLVKAGYTVDDSVNPAQTLWSSATAAFNGTYVPATGTTEATATEGSNYAEFTSLTGSTFTLSATPGTYQGSPFRAELMGIQIVSTPEPASLGLLGLSALGLLARRRRA